MRKMKKLLSMLVAATMTLAMAAPSFADTTPTPTSGTITIPNATVGNTYEAYQMFEANPSGSEDLIAYTATQPQVTALGGENNPYFEFEAIGTTGKYNVKEKIKLEDNPEYLNNLKRLFHEVDVKNSDGEVIGKKMAPAIDGVFTLKKSETATSATVTLNELPFGYYFVTSSLGTAVSVTSTNYEVSVLDKNQDGPHWNPDPDGGKKIVIQPADSSAEQFVDTTDANYGDTLHFQLKLDTTNYKGEEEITSYKLTDRLDNGLSYVMENGNVKIDAVSITGATVEATDYSITMISDNKGFSIEFPWKDGNNFKYASPATITVRYSATVTDTAALNTALTNTANFSYNNESESDTPEETKTYTYAVAINKITDAGVGLADAEFELKSGNTKINVSPVTDVDGVAIAGRYKYSATPTDTKIISPADGLIIISGLKEGNYDLTETKAPAGYNLLEDTLHVTINGEKDENGNDTSANTNKDKIVVSTLNGAVVENGTANADTRDVAFGEIMATPFENVVNVAGSRLPATGGIGTTIFYAAGIILMAGAVFFVVRRKRA